MIDFSNIVDTLNGSGRLLITIVVVLLLIFLFNFILRLVKKQMLIKAKSKKEISNIKIFTRMLNVVFVVLILFIAFFSYLGSWTGLGIFAGLLTASLGFALQKPITGIAAWLMIIIKRPFNIGDRIIIGNVRGDVYDISMSHIYLDEVGGAVDTEDSSGRTILVPNSILFEQNIINYTLMDDYVLSEVLVDVTYESDLDKAINIAQESALKIVKNFIKETNKEPKVRVKMNASSITLKVRFFAPVKKMAEIKSDITREIFLRIKKEKNVEIAYPHTEVIFKDKKLFNID